MFEVKMRFPVAIVAKLCKNSATSLSRNLCSIWENRGKFLCEPVRNAATSTPPPTRRSPIYFAFAALSFYPTVFLSFSLLQRERPDERTTISFAPRHDISLRREFLRSDIVGRLKPWMVSRIRKQMAYFNSSTMYRSADRDELEFIRATALFPARFLQKYDFSLPPSRSPRH